MNDIIYERTNFRGKFFIYESLQGYIEDNTQTLPISMKKLGLFFNIYIGFLILIMIVCLIHFLRLFSVSIIRYAKRIKFKISNFLRSLFQ